MIRCITTQRKVIKKFQWMWAGGRVSKAKILTLHFPFKVPLKSNSQYSFFYIFVHNKSFRNLFPNFKLLRTSELTFFRPLFPKIYGRHLFSLFQVLVENRSKWHHTLKNTSQVEIIITINVHNCTNIRAKFFVILMRIAVSIVIVISTCVVFLRVWCHLNSLK